jgi:hypothetical protein
MADNEEQLNIPESSIQRAESIKDSMLEIRNASRDANKALREQGEMLTDFGGLYSSITRSASKVAEIQERATRTSKATAQAAAEQTKQLNVVKTLNAKINTLAERALRLQGDAKKAVLAQAQALASARDNAQGLADNYGDIAHDAAALDKRTSFFTGLAGVVGDIPGLRKFAGPFEDAAKAARETVIANTKGGKKMSVLKAGAKGFAKSAASSAMSFMKSGGYVGLIVGGITGMVKLMLQIDKNSAKTASSMNMTKKEAADTAFEFQRSSTNMNYLTERLGKGLELANAFADSTGIISKNTEVFNEDLDTLNNRFGLSAELTGNLAKSLLASGQNTKDFAEEALGAAEAMEMQLGINVQSQAIMNDVAGASARFRMNSGGSAKAMATAAVSARKMGMSLSQVQTTADGLLDFETSIAAEMEAQLLTGKELNLDKARQFAAQGNLAGVAQEISKQEAVQEAFATNNYFAQEAIAKSLSMSVEELAQMNINQKALEKAGFSSADAREKEYQTLLKTMTQKEALEKIGMKEFSQQKKNISFQEKINNLVENLKSIFMTSLEPSVARVMEYLSQNEGFVQDTVDKVKLFAEQLLAPEGTVASMLDSFKSTGRVLKGLGQILNATLIQPLKAAYHVVMSIVEGIKAAMYAQTFQFSKAKEAAKAAIDHGALAVTNTLDIGTGIIAGVATMAGEENMNSTGISDAYESTGGASGQLDVKDFTIKPLGEDTITMAGGTKLGGNVEALLEKLISIVGQGGDVYLDGSKVGETLVLNSKLSN